MCLWIILFSILINKKARHLDKRKTDSSARERTSTLHTSEYTNSCAKKYIVLYYNKGTIDYNQQCHPLRLKKKKRQYKQFPQHRKSLKKDKETGKEREREREREEERVQKGRKKRWKREGEGEGKRGRESAKEKEKEK